VLSLCVKKARAAQNIFSIVVQHGRGHVGARRESDATAAAGGLRDLAI